MFARFDENPAMTLQDIKETKRYGRMDAPTDTRTDGQRENSIPTTKFVGGINMKIFPGDSLLGGNYAQPQRYKHQSQLQKTTNVVSSFFPKIKLDISFEY